MACKHTFIIFEAQGDGEGGWQAINLICQHCLAIVEYSEIKYLKRWHKIKDVSENND